MNFVRILAAIPARGVASVNAFQTSVQQRQREPKSVENKFNFVRGQKKDYNAFMDLLVNGFTKEEPHNRALKLTGDDLLPIYDYTVKRSLAYPFSVLVQDRESGKYVACRLITIGHRSDCLYDDGALVFPENVNQNVFIIAKMLSDAKKEFFDRMSGINSVLRREITYVDPSFQRKGIAKHLVYTGLDYEQLKGLGLQGIVSESTSLANQKLLEGFGYKCVYEGEKKIYKEKQIKLDDGTEKLKVYYYDLVKNSVLCGNKC